ncbi:MAG: hypothetical protein J6X56_08230 [Ruminococcus sp.]|nr:hypothetical protein [Ruminococcus sp.]
MKDFGRAVKMYIISSFSMILLVFGLGTAIMALSAMAADPAKRGDKDYWDMLGVMGLMHCMLIVIFFLGNVKISRYKFFGSLPQAKTLFTLVQAAVMGALCIVMDISAFTIAMVRCGADTAADLLIIDSADTVIACLLNATMQKQKNRFITVALGLLFIIFIDQVPVLKRMELSNYGFGLSLPQAAAAAAAIYIAGFLLVFLAMKLWWEKSGRNYNNAAVHQNILTLDR